MASIKKQTNGKYRARYRDDANKEHARHFALERDAQAWLDSVVASQVRHDYVDPRRSKVTVGSWSDAYMAGRVHLKPKTTEGYLSLLRTCILPTWGDVALTRISNADVVAWVAALRARGLSASRVRQSFHLLSSMLDAAVRDRRLPSNPAAGVDLPRLAKTQRHYLDHVAVHELARSCGRYRSLVLTLAYGGIRFGEAAALRARNVDLMRGRIEIVEAMTEVRGKVVFGTPKTHQHRSVPIPAFLRDLLTVELHGAHREDFVFAAPRGGVLRVGSFRRGSFDRAVDDLGLAPFTPHELRHTAASLAIAAGASIKGVQEMLGHASATMTLDLYGHLFGDELDGVAQRLDAAARENLADFSRTERGLAVLELPARDAG